MREGRQEKGSRRLIHAKFHVNEFTVSASGCQKNSWQMLTGGLLYRPPFTDEGQICIVCYS